MAGEIDRGGDRKRALDAFIEARVAEGYTVETHEDTHAIVVEGAGARSLLRRVVGRPNRFVVQVDDAAVVSMRPAEPIRS